MRSQLLAILILSHFALLGCRPVAEVLSDFLAPQNASLSIQGGADYTNTASVNLNLAGADAVTMYISNTAGCASGGNWEAFSSTKTWVLAQTNSTATVYAKFRDRIGNETACFSDTIIHDDTIPTGGSITIAGGASYTNVSSPYTVSLTLAATDTNPLEMYITDTAGCTTGGVWETYSATTTHGLAQNNGTATVYVKFRDAALNETACVSDTIIHDNTAPTGASITIAGGASYTNVNSPYTVSLTLAATDTNPLEMYLTDTAGCATGGTWATYSATTTRPLGQNNATATVYVKFRDAALNETACVSDTIIHDNTAPTGAGVTIAGGDAYTNVNSPYTVSLTLAAADANPLEMYITNTSGCTGGTWATYAATTNHNLGQNNATATVYVKFRDAALNETACVSDTIIHDNTAPTIQSATSSVLDSTSGNVYGAGSVVPIQVTFSEAVTVTTSGGTPTLTLETGTSDAVVNYTSGSGTNTLTYDYTVRPGDNANDLDYQSTSPFVTGGGTLQDAAGNNVNLTVFPVPGATNSLGANKDIQIASLWDTDAYLKASDAANTDMYGYSVGISGNTMVVGTNRSSGSGKAYALRKSAGSWTQEGILQHPDLESGDGFGFSVAVSGDTIVVGGPLKNEPLSTAMSDSGYGSAAVYRRVSGTWTNEAALSAPNGEGGALLGTFPFSEGDLFGASVAISGDTILVGAVQEDGASLTTITNSFPIDNTNPDSGAVYLFERTGSSWSPTGYIKAPNGNTGNWFGSSVSVSGDTIVVGAFYEDNNQTTITNSLQTTSDNGLVHSGASYVFRKTGTTWGSEAYLKAPNAGSNDEFGGDVSVSGDAIVVASAMEDSNQTTITNGATASADDSAAGSGAAYVFRRAGTTWAAEAYLKASNSGAGDNFGSGIGIAGDTIVVGALYEDSNQITITNGTSTAGDFGTSTDFGAAYVFKRTGTSWAMESYLKALNAGANDEFGNSVAISGRTVVVGARGEDSNTTAVVNNPTGLSISDNDTGTDVGSAYVFARTGETIGTPTVTRVFPSSGKPEGDHIHVFGTNFREASSLTIGGTACTSTYVQSSDEIICQLPASPGTGALTVTVTNPDGTTGSLAAAYEY